MGAALALLAPDARSAAFLVGATTPDPPTGQAPEAQPAAVAATPAGNGIRWTLGPIRVQGSLALELRRTTLGQDRPTDFQQLVGEIQLATYVWQPWFVRLNSTIGLVASRTSAGGTDAVDGSTSTGLGAVGQIDARVFPLSRFPLGVTLAVSDSRSSGETLVNHYRQYRFGLNQTYRPVRGNESYAMTLDYSRARMSSDDTSDSLITVSATSSHRWEDHNLDTGLNFSRNWQTQFGNSSRQASVFARHAYSPGTALTADTLASWSDSRFASRAGGVLNSGQAVQIVSVFNWRPQEDDWLYHPTAPVSLVGSVRLSESFAGGGGSRAQAFGVSGGISKQFSQTLRASGTAAYSYQSSPGGGPNSNSSAAVSLAYTPSTVISLGEWRYTPSATLALSGNTVNGEQQSALNLQGAHNASRQWMVGGNDSLSLVLTQSVGGAQQWPRDQHSYGVAHSIGTNWTSYSGPAAQTLVGLTLNDSRSWSQTFGQASFQMANLQISRRQQISRYNAWSANLTLQATRNSSSQQDLDAATGLRIAQGQGWQKFYAGAVQFDSSRVFGIPRLNFSAQLGGSSQQLADRRLGDPNAPLESVTQSAEARLDYSIGRLEARLSTRAAKVDGRKVNSVSARVQRRF